MTIQASGLFVYIKPIKKVGLLVDVQIIAQMVPTTGLNAAKELVTGPPQEQLVALATVALKDGWWGGTLSETLPVWEETEMDSMNPDSQPVAVEDAEAEGETDGSEADNS